MDRVNYSKFQSTTQWGLNILCSIMVAITISDSKTVKVR